MRKVSCEDQTPFSLPKRRLVVVISGPSGAGKDAVLTKMKESGCPLEYIVTVTTRPQRDKERNNVDYHFISTEKFEEMIEEKEFLNGRMSIATGMGVLRKQ